MRFQYLSIILFCLIYLLQPVYSQQQHLLNNYRTHTVSKGETAYSIATTYNITLQELYALNPDAEKRLKPNDVLRIPSAKTNEKAYFFHSIQSKETLYSVSKHYDIPIDQIIEINPGLSTENFKIGNVIRIPSIKKTTQPTQVANSQSGASDNYLLRHKVVAKETLYSLSNLYNVSLQDIADANPEIKNSGLKKDMVLLIPRQKTVTPTPSTPVATQTAYTNTETQPRTIVKSEKSKNDPIKVGLLLPLLNQKDFQRDRFIEYYEGFLLAVQDIKEKGYSAEIYTFDISKGNNTKKLESLLDTYEMKGLDIIIGGVTPEEITLLNKFSQEYGVKYAIPFPVKNEDVLQQSNEAFQVNIPLGQLYSKAGFTFCKYFRDYNVIIVEDNATTDDKSDFISVLNKNISISALSSKTVQISKGLEQQLKDALLPGSKNIIVPASSSAISLGKIIPAIRNIKNQNPKMEVNLFGYPEWQAYSAQYLQDFFRFGTFIYSSFYADSNDRKVQEFMTRFRNWYSKTLINTYPKYGLLGYDTGLYFMTALARHGANFENRLYQIKVPTLQSAFNFEKTENEGGYVNTGLYFIHYNTDSTIEKIDLSR